MVPAGGAAAFQSNTGKKGKACSAGKCQFPWDPRALAGPRCTHPRCVSCDMSFGECLNHCLASKCIVLNEVVICF